MYSNNLLTSYNGEPITYNNGYINTAYLNGSLFTFGWKGKSLDSLTLDNTINIKFKYTFDGKRIKKIINNSITGSIEYIYYYSGDNLIREEVNNNVKGENYVVKYIYDENNLLIGLEYNSKLYYYIRDILGNINKIVDESGNVVTAYEYDAYGNVLSKLGLLANINSFIYKGYYYDSEICLYFCNSRYYNPQWCRWISPDDVSYLDSEEVNGINLYCYCFNNPVMYSDGSGHSPEWWQWALAGVGIALIAVAAGMAILGTGGVAAFGIGALIGSSAVGVGGAVIGGVVGYVNGGSENILSGALTGFGIGAIVGFVIGGCIGLNTWNADVRMARQFLTDNGVDTAYHDNIINSFKYRIKTKTINSDMTVYRYYSGSSKRISYWVTPKQYSNPVQRLALAYGGNTAQNTATLTLQKGAQVLCGRVARVGSYLGGGIQYYVPNLAWLI